MRSLHNERLKNMLSNLANAVKQFTDNLSSWRDLFRNVANNVVLFWSATDEYMNKFFIMLHNSVLITRLFSKVKS